MVALQAGTTYGGGVWGEFWTTLGSAGLALLLVCTVLNCAAAVFLARLSLPRRLKIRLDDIEQASADSIKAVGEIGGQVASWRAGLEGLIDEAGNQFDRAERKRASAAATVSRMGAGNGPMATGEPGPEASRSERIAWIRSMARLSSGG